MVANQLKVSLIQTNLVWQQPEANRIHITNKVNAIKSTDLIILPEMFTSGFTMNASKVAETLNGATVNWLKNTSKEKQAAICGSIVIKEENRYYNRFVFVTPQGEIHSYDKRHNFTLAGEHKVYTSGSKKLIINYKGWKICPQICYDLRFPVWARNVEDYDLLIYVANWPAPRINAWDALLKARAIENMAYSIGVNRVGTDASGHNYPGHSAVYDALGEQLNTMTKAKEIVHQLTLSKSSIKTYREKLNFLNDRDNFTVEM